MPAEFTRSQAVRATRCHQEPQPGSAHWDSATAFECSSRAILLCVQVVEF